MRVEYSRVRNCYISGIQISVGRFARYMDAVIDTGATNTTISVDILVGSKEDNVIRETLGKLDRYAQRANVKRTRVEGVTEGVDVCKTYAYDACFENAIVGGHLMRKLHAKIMVNGAKGICVIGNDFLNMCKYYHNAGEYQLTVENPMEQKYYESFSGKKVLSNSQLNLILSEVEDETVFQSISEIIAREKEVDEAGNQRKRLAKKIVRVTEGFTTHFTSKSEPFAWIDFWAVVKGSVYALKLGYKSDVVELFGTGIGFTIREEENDGEDAIGILVSILREVEAKCEKKEDKAYVNRVIGCEQIFRDRWSDIVK